MDDIKMIIILIILTFVVFIFFVLIYNKNKDPTPEIKPKNINVKVPKFMDDFTTSYSTFDKNGKVVITAPLPNGAISSIQLSTGRVEINIKEVSTGKIVSTYNYRGTTGVPLTLDQNNTLNLPSTIVTIINNIPTQITIN